MLVHIVEHVGEHEPALGVGVDDLDGLPRHRGDDIARALGPAVDHVFYDTDGSDGVDFRFARSKRVHEPDHAGGSCHIAFHVLHAASGLDGNAAGIETDALADEGKRCGAALAAVPAHDDRAALVLGTLSNAE